MQTQVNRGLVFWGLALVTAGAVALLIQSGAIAEEAAREAWRWWPIALIVAGIAVIAARTPFALAATAAAAVVVGVLGGTVVAGWPTGLAIGCSGEPTRELTDDGAFEGGRASVRLHLDCGDIDVSTTAGADWSVVARHGGGDAPRLTADGESLAVESDGHGPFGSGRSRQAWEVSLPTDVELDLEVDVSAARSRIDVSDATVSGLDLEANAGDVRLELDGASVSDLVVDMNAGALSVTTDGATALVGDIEMNAGSLELCAPKDASVEILLDDPNVTFSHNLAERGFSPSGDAWRTGDGPPAVRLQVAANATSLTFNPDGGCT